MGKLAKATQSASTALTAAQSSSIEFRDDNGELITVSSEDVRKYICDKATAKEIVFFLELCRTRHLNPFTNDAYLVKYGDKPASIITANKVFLERADRNPAYRGMKHGVVVLRDGKVCHEERTAVYKAAGEQLLGGWARVSVDGREDVYAEVSLEEMSKGQSTWKQMPAVMIDKCAQGKALREAFPTELSGMYIGEEGGADVATAAREAREVEAEVEDAPAKRLVDTSPATDEQMDEIGNLAYEFAAARGDASKAGEALQAAMDSEAVTAAGYVAGGELTAHQATCAIDVLRSWVAKAKAEEVDNG